MGWRDITNSTNERTVVVATCSPSQPSGNNFLHVWQQTLELPQSFSRRFCRVSLATSSPRFKIGGTSLNFFIAEQIPVLPPDGLDISAPWDPAESLRDWLLPRILELTYTAWDLEPFASGLRLGRPAVPLGRGAPLPPPLRAGRRLLPPLPASRRRRRLAPGPPLRRLPPRRNPRAARGAQAPLPHPPRRRQPTSWTPSPSSAARTSSNTATTAPSAPSSTSTTQCRHPPPPANPTEPASPHPPPTRAAATHPAQLHLSRCHRPTSGAWRDHHDHHQPIGYMSAIGLPITKAHPRIGGADHT